MSDTTTGTSSDFPPVNETALQLTVRTVVFGAIVGGALSLANIYTGLKIGWGFNMSIPAALLAFGFFAAVRRVHKRSPAYGMLENNVNQTGASAAASVSSAGLVSAVPALTLLEGYQWSWIEVSTWVMCCSLLGVLVGVMFRRQMLVAERLPFASGIATAETLREMYAHGKEAMARVKALVSAALVGIFWKIAIEVFKIKALPLDFFSVGSSSDGALAKAGVASVPVGKFGFALDPSLLMVGAGAIIGLRIGVWMLIGAIVSWGVLGMYVLNEGWIAINSAEKAGAVGSWLLWPGVALLVTSSLTGLLFSAPAFVRAFRARGSGAPADKHDVPGKLLWLGVALITVTILIVGEILFQMPIWMSLIAVALTMVLAVVALRVSGETNVTPVGPMGKVTQLAFGAIAPDSAATNLMAANITGGSASQAADMMHDLKTGLLLGCAPKAQAFSQLVGVIVGALVGSAAYLVIMQGMTCTEGVDQFCRDGYKLVVDPDWKAPAVAQWKGVAELFRDGFDKMPKGSLTAMLIFGILGVVLVIAEKLSPKSFKAFVPSSAAVGIAFLISPATSMSFFIGGVIGHVIGKRYPSWHARFLIVIAAGLIAGESLTGMIITLANILAG